jgi:hypothetical protein
MDGIEKCLKISSCRALNALKGKDSEKMAVFGAFGWGYVLFCRQG